MANVIEVDFVAGFLGSGKTAFLNQILSESQEREAVLLMEQGNTLFSPHTCVFILEHSEDLNLQLIKIAKEGFRRIWVELNGSESLGKILQRPLPEGMFFGHLYTLVHKEQFPMYSKALGSLYLESIANGDFIILSGEDFPKEALRSMHRINPGAKIFPLNKLTARTFSYLRRGKDNFMPERSILFWMLGGIACVLGIAYISGRMSPTTVKIFQANTVFVALLLESLPFLLFGALFSGGASVYLSSSRLKDKFHGSSGYLFSLFSGLFLPFCDCAMPPIGGALLKGGVHLRYVLAFVLAAPLVNPITIVSTVAAYQGNWRIALYRIVFGLLTVVVTSEIFGLFWKKPVLKKSEELEYQSFYEAMNINPTGMEKYKAMLYLSAKEFYRMAGFLVLGAAIGACAKVFFSVTITGFGIYSTMIAAAFFISTCADTNAFMAKSMGFPLNTALGFMILGPMLSVKNLLLLARYFRKDFLLALTIFLSFWGVLFFGFMGKVVAL